ncbi:MAG TPA: asparagine synthase-related protein, partial [Vicinamibacterales bacterium]|nr:asparagine synthase-related protein [Vicinamibacterales bacterium]
MIGVFGHWPASGHGSSSVVSQMAAALRSNPKQEFVSAAADAITIGGLHLPGDAPSWCAESRDGRGLLWIAGDVFATRAPLRARETAGDSTWRQDIADALKRDGPAAINALNGEFQLAFWDREARALTLAVDRFATLPLYWSANRSGFTFAFGVRGVLMAPDVAPNPDVTAIRQAVTFAGYRLGDKTNIVDVRAMRPAHTVHVTDPTRATTRCYWSWSDLPEPSALHLDEAVEELRPRWRTAVTRRLLGTKQPGQTLSGGRDSRAILAEATLHAPSWTAFSYGIAGCDDVRFAQQAAHAAGANYRFLPLYGRAHPDWLERRSAHIQRTDGLIDLIDLMHLENHAELTAAVDCQLSGYLGDVIVGTTYDHVASEVDATIALSFLGSPMSLSWDEARQAVREQSQWDGSGATRATIFEHKFAQAIGRPNTALSASVRVRRPFIDLDVVDFAMSLPSQVRAGLYDAWALSTYQTLFADIPVQKTGVPLGKSPLRLASVRVGRRVRRVANRVRRAAGLTVTSFSRTYTNDAEESASPGIRERIEATILAPQSTVVELWGREMV